jgi:hypothetical protein
LLREKVPDRMAVTFIGENGGREGGSDFTQTTPHPVSGDGVIRFKVPYEFELTLSVLSEDCSVPWRLISLKVLVGEALTDRPVLLHEHQKLYLHQLVQSRLYSEDTPLRDCYQCLHGFCLSLQLDCLHSQVSSRLTVVGREGGRGREGRRDLLSTEIPSHFGGCEDQI